VHTQESEEIEGNLFKNKILEILAKIPESADKLYIGRLGIHPSFEISGTYDDNVFKGDSSIIRDEQDFYETYKPKISLELPLKNHSLNFDYGFDILEYHGGYRPGALEQDRVSRRWGGSADFNFENDFSILLSDRVNTIRIPGRVTRRTNAEVFDPVVPDPVEGEGEVLEQFGLNTFTRPRQFTNNVASIKMDLPDYFNKLDFTLEYSNSDYSYKTRAFKRSNDRNINIGKAMILIKALPKTEISTGIEFWDIRYDKESGQDSDYFKIPLNIAWIASAKSYFFLNTGYKKRIYSGGSIYRDFTGWDATLGYRLDVTERDNLLIKLERSLVEQQFMRDPYDPARGDNNPQDWTQINMKYTHEFPRRFSVILSPAIQHRSFRERQLLPHRSGGSVIKHQDITTLRFEASTRYTSPDEWLFGEITYRYIDIRSNVHGGDMINNVALISLGISF